MKAPRSHASKLVCGVALAGVLMPAANGWAAEYLVSGGGGNLATAIATANGNPGPDLITIQDSLDYVTGSVLIVEEELTIQAAAGQSPTITHNGAGGQVLRGNAALSIIGASDAARITLRHTGTSAAPVINTGANPALTHGLTLENVTLARQGSGAGFYLLVNNSGTALDLTNVNFTDGNLAPATTGVMVLIPDVGSPGLTATLNNVDMSTAQTSTNRILVNSRASVVANDSNFSTGAGLVSSFLLYTELSTLTHTFTDCTFGCDAAVNAIYYTSPFTDTLNIINPTIAGSLGQVSFSIIGGGTVNIAGADALAKVNLDGAFAAGTILLSRITNGNLRLTDVRATTAPAGYYNLVDSLGDLTGPVDVAFERCEFLDRTGGYLAQAGNGNGNTITVSLVNTIISGTNNPAATIFNMIKDNSNKSLNLLHSTLFNPPAGWVLMQGDANTTVNTDYSILDGTGGAGISGTVTLLGDYNLLEGFALVDSPATNFVGVGPIDYVTGRLTAEGLASGNAIGSTLSVDVDGTIRPQGAPTPDIGAHEAPFGDPLLIELGEFAAHSDGVGHSVHIRWATATEIDNVGFHVDRVLFTDAGVVAAGRVNDALIPGAGTSQDGAQYSFVDSLPLAAGERRGYVLIDVDANGA